MADSVLASHIVAPYPPAHVLVVHGGAYEIPTEGHQAHLEGCRRAADVGRSVLRSGGSALEAVETAARLLEDDPTFDAGRGSFVNAAAEVEKVSQQVPLEKKQ